MYHDVSLPFLSILNCIAFSPFISFFLFSPLDSFDFLIEKIFYFFDFWSCTSCLSMLYFSQQKIRALHNCQLSSETLSQVYGFLFSLFLSP